MFRSQPIENVVEVVNVLQLDLLLISTGRVPAGFGPVAVIVPFQKVDVVVVTS